MKRIKQHRPPPWSASFKPKDGRKKPRYRSECRRCGKAIEGTEKEVAQSVYCSSECVPAPLHERWDNLVNKEGDCWLWKGTLSNEGYGLIREGDRMVLAHRVSLRLKLGLEELDGFACHTCDNRGCVNPAHLYIGTHEDNMHDMSVANSASNSKTEWGARMDMARGFYAGHGVDKIAAEYGVSERTVRRWAKALGPDPVIPDRRRSPFASVSSVEEPE